MPQPLKFALFFAAVIVAVALGTTWQKTSSQSLLWEQSVMADLHDRATKPGPSDETDTKIGAYSRTIADPRADANTKANAYSLRAALYFRAKRYADAERDVTAGLALHSPDPADDYQLYAVRAADATRRHDGDAAIDAFGRMIALGNAQSGLTVTPYLCRAATRTAMGDTRGALTDLDLAARGAVAVRGTLVRVMGAYGPPDVTRQARALHTVDRLDAGIAYARGDALSAAGRNPEAIAAYSQAIAKLPDDPKLFVGRAHAHFRNGEWGAGFGDLSHAASLSFRGQKSRRRDLTMGCGA